MAIVNVTIKYSAINRKKFSSPLCQPRTLMPGVEKYRDTNIGGNKTQCAHITLSSFIQMCLIILCTFAIGNPAHADVLPVVSVRRSRASRPARSRSFMGGYGTLFRQDKFELTHFSQNDTETNTPHCHTSIANSRSYTASKKPCFMEDVATDIRVEENEPILLRCLVYNVNFSTVVISWWREGQMRELTLGLESANSRYRLPRLSYQDWSLEIKNARPEDSGIYVCQINLEQTLEKFFFVNVKKKPLVQNRSRIMEHEFVKDEAFDQNILPKMYIDGLNEGHVGSALKLTCIARFAKLTTTSVVWSHGNGPQRYYLSPTNNLEDVEFFLHPTMHPEYSSLSGNQTPTIRTAASQNANIYTTKTVNGTIRSTLTLKPLSVDHAGVWRCTKVTFPASVTNEEAKVMVYVRKRKAALHGMLRHQTKHDSKDSASKNALPKTATGQIGTEVNRIIDPSFKKANRPKFKSKLLTVKS
ncbi:unnamed protein product [Calicophoron daubneyi]|uniref:Ig-like domain-containing protein n=1 Tax=Calicophoron daubneyi TaxID=300641 RepID=A0AAV2TG48_CALDB